MADFSHRNRYRGGLLRGPKRPIRGSVATLRCQGCGETRTLEIAPWVQRDYPPTEAAPLRPLEDQALVDGWALGVMQVRAGDSTVEWDYYLCPHCADQTLERAAKAMEGG